jgi:hypothetical protein
MTTPQDPYGQPNVPPAAPPLNESELRGAQDLPAPSPVQASFWLWIVTAVLGLIGTVIGFTQRDAALAAVRAANTQHLDDATLQAAVTAGLAFAAVIAVVFAALYVLFAFKTRAGRNWARITLTVLTALRVLLLIPSHDLLSVLAAVVAVVAVVLLYLPASAAFFTASRRVAR